MIRCSFLFLTIAALGGVAVAQVPPTDEPPVAPSPEPAPAPAPAPAPEPSPAPAPAPVIAPAPTPTAARVDEAAPAPARSSLPDGFAIGFGVGYALPSDLQAPDITSVRFRLRSGVTLEPFFALVMSDQTTEQGTTMSQDTSIGVSFGAQLRHPLAVRGPFELSAIGMAGVASVKIDPDGDNNTQARSVVSVLWGLGVDFWIRRHWSINVTATNPLFAYERFSDEALGGSDATVSRSVFGLVFDPNLIVMGHVFF
jgi:hypothetical protein